MHRLDILQFRNADVTSEKKITVIRRQYIALGVSAVSVGIAGCTGSSDPQEEYAENVVETIERESGLTVHDWELRDDGTFYLEFGRVGATGHEIEIIAQAYAPEVDDGFESPLLGAAVSSSDDEIVHTFDIETEWAQDWIDEEISLEEYVDLIRDTIEEE